MYQNVSLEYKSKTIRGVVLTPDGPGPFPCVCFYHGFSVDKVGLMRLHELFARKLKVEGFASVRFDFYGCGESDGDFSEMRFSDECEEAKMIYEWAKNQHWAKKEHMFICGHSLGGAISSVIAPVLQPKGVILWAPGNTAYYDISGRVAAIPNHYEELYDVGGMNLAGDFLLDIRKHDIVAEARGYNGKVLLIHGEKDEKVPVASVGPYLDMYKDQVQCEIIWGANHQFSSVKWKNEVYDLSIADIKGIL